MPSVQAIANLIETTPAFLALIDQPDVLLAAINEKTIAKTNSELLTNRTIINTFPIADAATIIGAFKAAAATNPLYDSVYVTLCSTGIDFSNALTQAQIDQLTSAGAWTAETGDKLKALGIWKVSAATSQLGADATADDLKGAITYLHSQQLQRTMAAHWNAVSEAILDGTITDRAGANAKFAEDLA